MALEVLKGDKLPHVPMYEGNIPRGNAGEAKDRVLGKAWKQQKSLWRGWPWTCGAVHKLPQGAQCRRQSGPHEPGLWPHGPHSHHRGTTNSAEQRRGHRGKQTDRARGQSKEMPKVWLLIRLQCDCRIELN